MNTFAVFNPLGPALMIEAERLIDARDKAVTILNEGRRRKIEVWDVTTVLIKKGDVDVAITTIL